MTKILAGPPPARPPTRPSALSTIPSSFLPSRPATLSARSPGVHHTAMHDTCADRPPPRRPSDRFARYPPDGGHAPVRRRRPASGSPVILAGLYKATMSCATSGSAEGRAAGRHSRAGRRTNERASGRTGRSNRQPVSAIRRCMATEHRQNKQVDVNLSSCSGCRPAVSAEVPHIRTHVHKAGKDAAAAAAAAAASAAAAVSVAGSCHDHCDCHAARNCRELKAE